MNLNCVNVFGMIQSHDLISIYFSLMQSCMNSINENPHNDEIRNDLVRQIVELLYTVRNNLMHGRKTLGDSGDLAVVTHVLPMLVLMIESFIK